MFSPDYMALAERLKASLEQFGLNYALYQVPSIHRSISPRGSDDMQFCKPSFIEQMLTIHATPILYLDADTVVRAPPDKITQIANRGIDFAIYNWFADDATAAYVAVPFAGSNNRFYVFSYSVDLFDPQQLFASGAVQFYTNNARRLLRAWFATINNHPNVADDESLDYSFNIALGGKGINAEWLTKDYCRCLFWPHVQPVIDHPQLVDSTKRNFPHARFGAWRLWPQPGRELFERDLIFDSETKNLLRMTASGPTVVGTLTIPFFTS